MRINPGSKQGKKRTAPVKLILVNLAALACASYVAGGMYSMHKYKAWNLDREERVNRLAPGKCEDFDCRGFTDFNTAKQAWATRGDETPCLMSNPIFGYTNTCTKGRLGLSKETDQQKDTNTVRILLLGGSQANITTPYLQEALNKYLKQKHPRLRGEVFGAALGGGKQPMQIQAANALLALGYKFDAIVNINGWNEIVLATLENNINGISTIYPRGHIDRLFLTQRALATDPAEQRQNIATRLLGYHPLWNAYEFENEIRRRKIISGRQNGAFFISRLKLNPFPNLSQEDRLNEAERIWVTSSRNSFAISEASGVKYLEVIQPSLNHTKSKSALTSSEASLKCQSDSASEVLNNTYSKPASQLTGTPSKNTFDARYIFRDMKQSSYSDCVHLNSEGSAILAKEIVRRTIQLLGL